MEEELDLREIFEVFWEKKLFIIIAAVVGILMGVIYTAFFVTPKYTSTTTLVLTKASKEDQVITEAITQSDITLNQKLISTYGEIIKSKAIINRVITELNIDYKYSELIKAVNIKAIANTDVMKLSVTTKDPEISFQVANHISDVFGEEVERIYGIKNIFVIDRAEKNENPVNINWLKNMALACASLVIVVMAVIFLLYFFDNSIRSKEDIEKLLEVPVIGVIPMVKELEVKENEKK